MIITKNSSGQVALLVLVVSAIVMTVGLSISKKTVVETKISTEEEQLKQAFNAAESGIDYYLTTGELTYTASDSKSKAEVTTTNVGGGANLADLGRLTLSNQSDYFWLVPHNADGSINYVKFGGNSLSLCVDSGFVGALKVDYFYRLGGEYSVARLGYNFGGSNLVSGYLSFNGVTVCPGTTDTVQVDLSVPIGGAIEPLLIAVKPIRGSTRIMAYSNGGSFPDQAVEISSVGKVGNISGNVGDQVNRKVRVINQYSIPDFMVDPLTAIGRIGL